MRLEDLPMTIKRRYEMGSGGECFCPKCGDHVPHTRGRPCQEERCPQCGAKMMRKGSYHHELLEKKRAETKQKDQTKSGR